MALKLAKTTEEGFNIEYWRVSPVVALDLEERTARARVLAYASANARSQGKRPVALDAVADSRSIQNVELTGQQFEDALVAGDPRPAMYTVLKAKDFFTGAEDV